MFESTPKPIAKNHLADIMGINLQYALDAFEWEDCFPMTDNGITVTGFWHSRRGDPIPEGYELAESGNYYYGKMTPENKRG